MDATVSVGELLRAVGAIKEGHFLFSSGLHGDTYVEKFDLLRNPPATERVCRGFVAAYRDAGVEVVVGPTTTSTPASRKAATKPRHTRSVAGGFRSKSNLST